MLATKNSPSGWMGLLSGLGLLLVAACAPQGPQALLQGERLMTQGRYLPAVERLKVAVQQMPQHAQAWNHLGLAFHHAGQPQAAMDAYRRALTLNPKLTQVRYNLGVLMLDQGDIAGAADELSKFTVMHRDSADGWTKLGATRLRLHQWPAAEASFAQALRLRREQVEAWNGLGVAQTYQRRQREATASFVQALQIQRTYPPALLNLATLTYTTDRRGALQRYREFLNVAPASPVAPNVKEIVRRTEEELNPPPKIQPSLERSPRPQEATPSPSAGSATPSGPTNAGSIVRSMPALLPPALPPMTNPPPKVVTDGAAMSLSVSNAAGSNGARATNVAPAAVLTAGPAGTPAAAERVSAASGMGAALSRGATSVVAGLPSRPPVLVVSSVALQPPEGVPATQIRVVDDREFRVAQDVPNGGGSGASKVPPVREVQANGGSGAAQVVEDEGRDRSLGQRLNPINWFRGSGAEKPKPITTPLEPNPVPRVVPEVVKSETSDEAAEVVAARERESSAPAAAPVRVRAVRVPAVPVAKPMPEVREPVAAVVSPAPNWPRYRYRTGGQLARGNRAAGAAAMARGLEWHRSGQIVRALEEYRVATRTDPTLFEAHYNMGLAAYQIRDWALALSASEWALSINPTSVDARLNLALALQEGGYPLDAAAQLEQVVRDRPEDGRAQFALGKLYADVLGRPELAAVHYDRLLKLEPNHPDAPAIRRWLAGQTAR